MHRLLAYGLAATFLLTGCPRSQPGEDDDDSSVEDDDSGGDDDDAAADCASPDGPYELVLSGGQTLTLSMAVDCSNFGGDSWQIRFTEASWVLRVTTGPLIDGQPISDGVSITLLDAADISNTYAGNTFQGHFAEITAEGYTGGPPCGTFVSDPLPNTSIAGGPDVTFGPQPFPFRCP
jgi:hypothetical protein